MKLLESTTFQFCGLVLTVSALAAVNDGITWSEWLNSAVYFVGIYAGKEGVKYGASAYENKS